MAEVRKLYRHGRLDYYAGFVELDGDANWDLLRRRGARREARGTTVPAVSWAWVPGRGKVELIRKEDLNKVVEPIRRATLAEQAKQRAADLARGALLSCWSDTLRDALRVLGPGATPSDARDWVQGGP
jgi:hypothetical protein